MDPDSEIHVDFSPYLRIYKSGRLERLVGTDRVAAGIDPATGVNSKDVVIDAATGVSVRLYLPDLTTDVDKTETEKEKEKKKMPVLVYFHGGGFLIESATSPTYHSYLNSLVDKARVLAVSVDYRLAPEHPLPAAYDDCWDALKWVASNNSRGEHGEPWLDEHGDLGRIFLAGDSAGGNIVHNTAVTAALRGLGGGSGARIEGIILIHPYFWGKEPVGSEPTDVELREKMEKGWEYVCGGGGGVGGGSGRPEDESGRGGGGECVGEAAGAAVREGDGVRGGEGLPEGEGEGVLRGCEGERVGGDSGEAGAAGDGGGGPCVFSQGSALSDGAGDDEPHRCVLP